MVFNHPCYQAGFIAAIEEVAREGLVSPGSAQQVATAITAKGVNNVASAGSVSESGVAATVAGAIRRRVTPRVPIRRVAGFQAAETWTKYVGNGTVGADTADFKYGTQSLEVVTAADTTGCECILPAPVSVRGGVGVWIKVVGLSSLTNIQLQLYEHATNTPLYACSFFAWPHGLVEGEWKLLWFPRRLFVATNTPAAWGTTAANASYSVARLRMRHTSTVGNVTVNWGDVVTVDPPKAGLAITFDDALASIYTTVWPDMKARGWPLGVSVISSKIDTEGYMTTAQLQELYATGLVDFYLHSFDHNYDELNETASDAEIIAQWTQCRTWMLAAGLHRSLDIAVAPGNKVSGTNGIGGDLMEALGINMSMVRTARAVYGGLPAETLWYSTSDNVTVYDWPWYWHDPLNYPRCGIPGAGSTFEDAGGMRDMLARLLVSRNCCEIYGHFIQATPEVGDSSQSTAMWTALLAWLDTQVAAGTIDVLSLSQIRDATRPYIGAKFA